MKANQKIQSVELPTPGKELHILMLNNFLFFFCIFVNAFIVSCTCLSFSLICVPTRLQLLPLCVFLFVCFVYPEVTAFLPPKTKPKKMKKIQMKYCTSWDGHEALQLSTVLLYFKISYCAHCLLCKVCKYRRNLTTPDSPNHLFF